MPASGLEEKKQSQPRTARKSLGLPSPRFSRVEEHHLSCMLWSSQVGREVLLQSREKHRASKDMWVVGGVGNLVLFVYIYFKAEETRARFSVGTEGAGDGERMMH